MSSGLRLRDDTIQDRAGQLYRQARGWAGTRLRRRLSRGPANDVFSRVPLGFEVMAYFAETPVNLYQIRQWLYPLERLDEDHPVFILTRNTTTFRILSNETTLPIVNALRIATLDCIATHSEIKLCLYVNQAARNFQALRYPDMLHVFLSHGESEKSSYMASNQLKAYDFTFVAGDAAVDRIRENLVSFDHDVRLRRIGRPQLDMPRAASESRESDRTTVLYAPTWEGDRPSIAYGSIESHGRHIVETLTNSLGHRIVYRPHPRTGATLSSAAYADAEIRHVVERAAHRSPGAGHRVDTQAHFGPQMGEADLMITDVSAVALDFLPTGKPLVLTVPVAPDATINWDGVLGSMYELPVTQLHRLEGMVDNCIASDSKRADRERWVEYYFGDITPGASIRRFLDTCHEVIHVRDDLVTRKRGAYQPQVTL